MYLDSIQVKTGKVKLMAGDSLKLNAQPFGKTVTLIASQVPSHPSEVFVSTTIEGCSDTIGSVPHVLVNHFPKVQTASSKTQCLPVLTSIDPNDKQVFPTGFTANHVVPPGTQLEYLVRFQNTGNDTAFTAYVVDSLDQNLNVESLEIGAVSHAYEVTLQTTRQGRNVLRFQFDHIYLPDSTTNELQSHGFIQYRISPKADIPLGTQVKNEAAIYFDYNPPVVTNQTLTTFDNLILTDSSLNSHVQIVTSSQPFLKKRDLISVFPNPFSNGITLQSGSAESLSVSLCDLMGKEVQLLHFTGSADLSLSHLPDGVYFLKIPSRNQTLKLVKQE